MYLTKHRIEYNWRHLDMTPPNRLKTLKGHDDHVVRANVVYQAVDFLPCTHPDAHSS